MAKTKADRDSLSSLYRRAIRNNPLLSREQQIELGQQVEAGDKIARDKFIQANLGLVISVARTFAYAPKSLTMHDLIQEGNIGLIKAVEKWDHRRGFTFSTYAVPWIRSAIMKAIADTDQMVDIPQHLYELVCKYKKVSREQGDALGVEPGLDQIALSMGLTEGEVDRLKEALFVERVTSLDKTKLAHDGEEGDPLWARISDKNILSPEEELEKDSFRSALEQAMQILTEREREVLGMRLGEASIKEIGEKFGFSWQRASQVKQAAIRKVSKHLKAAAPD